MTRVQLIRELDARAWSEGKANGIVPDMGAVAILKHTDSKGRSRRYYGCVGEKVTRKELIHRARKLDAKDGLQALLAKCLRESAIEELRMRREASHG